MSTWVFLRGLTREARHWGDFPATFKATIPDTNVVTPNLPGNGALNYLTSPLKVCEMVEYCRNQLSGDHVSPPYHLLGLSLGGIVAVEWATRYPHEVLSCVLINTSIRSISPFYHRLRPRNYLRLLSMSTQKSDPTDIECSIFRMTSARREPQAGVIEAWVSYRKEYPVTRLNALRQLITAARYRAPLKRPDVPLLILAGLKDGLVDARCSQRIASHWGTALRTHAEGGMTFHWMMAHGRRSKCRRGWSPQHRLHCADATEGIAGDGAFKGLRVSPR